MAGSAALSTVPAKAAPDDFPGRFREIVSDPLNLLIRRHPAAGTVEDGLVVMHNGTRVPLSGPEAYYGRFSEILVINRGVHEPLEEYAFQEMLPLLPEAPVMLELGAYWGHYSMWLGRVRPAAQLHLVEPDPAGLAAGRANFARNGLKGTFVQAFVGTGGLRVDDYLGQAGIDRLDVLHADIQGKEVEMLDGARHSLADGRIDRCLVSTHSQELHDGVIDRLRAAGLRIEVEADFDRATTSFDGFVMASRPELPPALDGPAPLGREEIAAAAPERLLQSLHEIAGRGG